METYTSDSSDTDSKEQKTLDYSRLNLNEFLTDANNDLETSSKLLSKSWKDIEILLLNHNCLTKLPNNLKYFQNLRILDLSSNRLTSLPAVIAQLPLITLVAKNNQLTNESLPKTFLTDNQNSYLKELNLSGNLLRHFPEQVLELTTLKYLYLGGNQIRSINKDIWRMKRFNLYYLHLYKIFNEKHKLQL